MDLPLLHENHTFILTTSWNSVSDTKKGLELMYPNKSSTVVVFYNKKTNFTQPFVCLLSNKAGMKGLPALVEAISKPLFFEKILAHLITRNGNLVVFHCGKGEALQAGRKKGLNVVGIDARNEMVRSCNKLLY
ncbi:uncharacterized protein LOC133197993 [Saccostrea echinata]|uniref:uncharacterized protein LOC133197993 n=1 Tax=Saccostrea echinata TaxID=191078 RepID=UPI002A80D3EA|nr:uncharacterized protein LOC133197993 [Saccostrea echinata]